MKYVYATSWVLSIVKVDVELPEDGTCKAPKHRMYFVGFNSFKLQKMHGPSYKKAKSLSQGIKNPDIVSRSQCALGHRSKSALLLGSRVQTPRRV
jgi:hypothetical protein